MLPIRELPRTASGRTRKLPAAELEASISRMHGVAEERQLKINYLVREKGLAMDAKAQRARPTSAAAVVQRLHTESCRHREEKVDSMRARAMRRLAAEQLCVALPLARAVGGTALSPLPRPRPPDVPAFTIRCNVAALERADKHKLHRGQRPAPSAAPSPRGGPKPISPTRLAVYGEETLDLPEAAFWSGVVRKDRRKPPAELWAFDKSP